MQVTTLKFHVNRFRTKTVYDFAGCKITKQKQTHTEKVSDEN